MRPSPDRTDKVFGKRRDDQIHKDVASTIEILETFADRRLGEEIESEFLGTYCRFAIVIAGKAQKIQLSVDPYVKYLSNLLEEGYESIYLLSPLENKKRLEGICVHMSDQLVLHRHIELHQTIHPDDGDNKIRACLFVIRSKGFKILQTNE